MRENLLLIEERMAEYVLDTDIPLDLIKRKRRLEGQIRWLEQQMEESRPINVLRDVTKLLTGPVARALNGEPWKPLRQRLLTQASKLPRAAHIDAALLRDSAGELIQLAREVQVLLEAYRIEPNPGQLEALRRRAGVMADYLISIYRLEAGDAPELEPLLDEDL
jgi:hypothetical protein